MFNSIKPIKLLYLDETNVLYTDPVCGEFTGTDSYEKFLDTLAGKNKNPHSIHNVQGWSKDWYYRNAYVKYTRNSLGYRAPEFNQIDWSRSVLVLGCSNAYGVGISDEHTITTRITEKTGVPAINMAIPAGSMLHCLHTSLALRELYPTVRGIAYVWPSKERTLLYTDKTRYSLGPWTGLYPQKDFYGFEEYYKHFLLQEIYKSQAHIIQLVCKQILYSTNTKMYECSIDSYTAEFLNVEAVGKTSVGYIDYGRDLSHPGIKTAEAVADSIIKGLNL